MAFDTKTRDLAHAKLATKQAHSLIRQLIGHPDAIDYFVIGNKLRSSDAANTAFAICEYIESVADQFEKEFWTESAAVEDYSNAPFPDQTPDLFEHRRKTVENGLRLALETLGLSPEAFGRLLPDLPFRGRRVEELRPEDIEIVAEATIRAKG